MTTATDPWSPPDTAGETADRRAKMAALYDYSRTEYSRYAAHYEWLERKAERYLTTLAILVGGVSYLLITALPAFVTEATPYQRLAAAAAILSACMVGVSAVRTIDAMAVKIVRMPSIDEKMIGVFQAYDAGELHEVLARDFLAASRQQMQVSEERSDILKEAHRYLQASFCLSLAAAILVGLANF